MALEVTADSAKQHLTQILAQLLKMDDVEGVMDYLLTIDSRTVRNSRISASGLRFAQECRSLQLHGGRNVKLFRLTYTGLLLLFSFEGSFGIPHTTARIF
jgi:hypothetical protein